MNELLRIECLRTLFPTPSGEFAAVAGIDLTIERGRTLAIVGESGSGKSALSLSIMRLIPSPGRIGGGAIIFDGQDLLKLRPTAMRELRGRRIDPRRARNADGSDSLPAWQRGLARCPRSRAGVPGARRN